MSEVRVVDQTPAVGLGPAVSRALALSLAEQGWDCRPGRAGQPLEVVLAEVDGRWLGASDGAGIEAWGVRTRWRWGTGEGARHGETWVRGGSGQQLAGAPGVSSGTVGVGGADEGRHSLAGRAVAEALVTWLEWVGDGDR